MEPGAFPELRTYKSGKATAESNYRDRVSERALRGCDFQRWSLTSLQLRIDQYIPEKEPPYTTEETISRGQTELGIASQHRKIL
jgi:hypothetical protein